MHCINLFSEQFLKININSDMKQLFKKKRELKSGREGSTYLFPTIVTIHTNPDLI